MIPRIDSILISFLTIVLTLAAIQDIRAHKIPNLLTFPAMVTALTYHTVTGGFEGFLFSTQGLGVGLAILILPYLKGGMGAGDAKLMGAVGATLGPEGAFIAFLFTAIFGGIYGLVLLLAPPQNLRGLVKRWATMLMAFLSLRQLIYIPPTANERKLKLCYGLAIAAGTLGSVVWRIWEYPFPI
jgi:prepilin peptidase CpaA